MMKIHLENTKKLLVQLTSELKSLKLWQAHKPSAVELASTAPFCCDTLTFEQWLQFIFIPKIIQMIKLELALPTKIALTPMAQESFKHLSVKAKPLFDIIQKIDQTLTGQGK